MNYYTKSSLPSLGVAKQSILVENRFRSYVHGFSTQGNYYSTAHKVASEPKYFKKPQTRTATKTTRHCNSRYFCDFKQIFKKTCHDHAGFVLCLLLFFLFFRQKDASGRPSPAKPLLLPGNDLKTFCNFSKTFAISTLRPSSEKFKDF